MFRFILNLVILFFLKGLLKVREDFLGCGTFKIGDGSQTIDSERIIGLALSPLKNNFLACVT